MTAQRLLFIGGVGRSGSTLIEKLLNEFEDTFAVGETVHLWERGLRDNERCGCNQPFDQCEHWGPVGEHAFGGWGNVDLEEAIQLRWTVDRTRRLPEMLNSRRRSSTTASQRRYLDLIRPVLLNSAKVAGGHGPVDVLLDSSKHLSAAALYSLDPALDVRVLHVVRDPRGVAYSWMKQVKRPEASLGGEDMPIYRPSRTAGRWVSDNLGFDLLARMGVPTLRVRYEDFLDRPVESLAQMAEFAGLKSKILPMGTFDGTTGHCNTTMHSVAGNPLRFGGDDIKLRLDDEWRTKLDPDAKRLVSRITAPLRRQYNYD